MSITIYHNPRCSKSRQTLALLQEHGVEPQIIDYLKNAPSVSTLKSLRQKLGFTSARAMMRTGEPIYKELDLKNETDEDKLLAAMAAHPKLIERPIVVRGDKAVLGRPPQNILAIL